MKDCLIYSTPLKDVGHLSGHALRLGRGDHLCQFYQNDDMLMDALAQFVIPGLSRGDGIIIIATEKNRALLKDHLNKRSIDVAQAMAREQLLLLDAQTTLDHFMVEGSPDRTLFLETISPVLKNMRSKFPVIRAYGEMVNILFHQYNYLGTRLLEELWNELGRVHPFSLMCGYAMNEQPHEKLASRMEEICATHTHLISNYGTLFTRQH